MDGNTFTPSLSPPSLIPLPLSFSPFLFLPVDQNFSLANPSLSIDHELSQPSIFRGQLKAYQLKGMNWLASLYDQVHMHVTCQSCDDHVICRVSTVFWLMRWVWARQCRALHC